MPQHKDVSQDNTGVDRIPQHLLNPTLQVLAGQGIQIRHFDQLRTDHAYLERISRLIKTGGWNMREDERRAFDILGEKFVIAERSTALLDLKKPSYAQKWIPYSDEILRKCDSENTAGTSDWRLVFVTDTRPMQLFVLMGKDLFFLEPNDPAHAPKRTAADVFECWDKLFRATGVYGYRLINFMSQFSSDKATGTGAKWSDQVKAVGGLDNCEIAPPHWVMEAWYCHYRLTGSRYLQQTATMSLMGTHHMALGGKEKDPDSLVALSGFVSRQEGGPEKFLVHCFPFREHPYGGVMVVRRPDNL